MEINIFTIFESSVFPVREGTKNIILHCHIFFKILILLEEEQIKMIATGWIALSKIFLPTNFHLIVTKIL